MCLSLYALVLRTLVIDLHAKNQLNYLQVLRKKLQLLKSTKSKARNLAKYQWSVMKLKLLRIYNNNLRQEIKYPNERKSLHKIFKTLGKKELSLIPSNLIDTSMTSSQLKGNKKVVDVRY